LLTYSEQFDNAAWTKIFSSVTANTEAAPDGTTTADLMVEDSTTNGRYLQQSFTTTVQSYTFSCYFKQPTLNARRYVLLYHNESVKGWVFDIQNGVVGAGGTSGVTAPAAYTITSVGNGWYRCAITITGTAASNQFRAYIVTNDGTGLASYAGNGLGSMLVWGAQVETGSSATAYQKVGLTSDVTESGKRDCWGLLFDGSDDNLLTASVNFSATDEMTVMVGVRKLSDGSYPIIAELSTNWTSNNGSFSLSGNLNNGYAWSSRGTGGATVLTTDYLAPVTTVLGLQSDVSGPSLVLRANGSEINTSSSSQGLGNYGTWPIYISSRAGSSNYFNGLIYTLIVRGATTPTQTIKNFERNLLALRCGVTF
jgi:hypothetical protein